jgi:hypothetical protein
MFLARQVSNPYMSHWRAALRVLGYLKKTINLALFYPRANRALKTRLTVYSDADWGGCVKTRRSTSGMSVLFNGTIHWKSKLQSSISLSTCEAEIVALSLAATETIAIQRIIDEIYQTPRGTTSTLIYEDNKAALEIARNPCNYTKMKHVEMRHLFVREKVKNGDVHVERCKSEDMIADLMTKTFNRDRFQKLRAMLMMREDPTIPRPSTSGSVGIVRTDFGLCNVALDTRIFEYLPWEDMKITWHDLHDDVEDT